MLLFPSMQINVFFVKFHSYVAEQLKLSLF